MVSASQKRGKQGARVRVANATYNHCRIVLALKRQLNTLKQRRTRLNRKIKARKDAIEEKRAYLNLLVDFIASDPDIAAIRKQYD